MQQLTNLVVNRTADNIAKSFTGIDIEKARHGVYADTEENRRLHRVGQEYGKTGKKEEPAGDKGKKPEEQAGKGGKKPEQQPANKKPAQKEELFSKNGMLDEGGKLNQKSEHVKRMYELEKKVDSGKATPEEKQEYATLRNQAKNESDRYVHEGRKKLGVKEDEPKYKTVEERRADYKAQKQAKEEKPADKMRKDKKAADLANSIDGLAFTVFNDPDGEYGKLLDEGYDVDSKKVKDVVFRETVNVSKPFFEDIRYAVNKYGKDAVKELMSETDLFDSFEGLDDYVISQAIVAGKEQGNEEQKKDAVDKKHKLLKEYISDLNKLHYDENGEERDYSSPEWQRKNVESMEKLGTIISENKITEKEYNEYMFGSGDADGYDLGYYDYVEPKYGAEQLFDQLEERVAAGNDTLSEDATDRFGNTMKFLIQRGLSEKDYDDLAKNHQAILGVFWGYNEFKFFNPSKPSHTNVGTLYDVK